MASVPGRRTPATSLGARALAVLGDSVTTDHISPAGSIARTSPAGEWLVAHGVDQRDFNSYGARRGHHEVMVRGTFANIRLRNLLTPDAEGNVTEHLPSGERMSIFDAAMRYATDGTPLIVLAGKEYGSGSSRDWAAKGPLLQGVRAVIAESYERIHRSNLVGMGILPLQFLPGESVGSLGLSGRETFDVTGVADGLRPRMEVAVTATGEDGRETRFRTVARLDGEIDVTYLRNGGVLQTVLRDSRERWPVANLLALRRRPRNVLGPGQSATIDRGSVRVGPGLSASHRPTLPAADASV